MLIMTMVVDLGEVEPALRANFLEFGHKKVPHFRVIVPKRVNLGYVHGILGSLTMLIFCK